MKPPKVAIIIVVWNGIADTLECLRSLAADLHPNKELIVVDNASIDGSSEIIREAWPSVHVVQLQINSGFTGGNNAGLAAAARLGVKYAFLLNNDTTVEPAALTALVAAAERFPGVGILAPVTHYYDTPSQIWFSGAVLRLLRGQAIHDSRIKPDIHGEPYESPWVSGCAMLVRMVAVDVAGGFDDRFYLTWEDVDWCIRMRDHGWSVQVVPAARIFHKCSKATQRLSSIRCYYAVRNSLLLARKHAGIGYWSALACVLWNHFRDASREVASERTETLRTIYEGLIDHWRGRYGCRSSVHRKEYRPVAV